MAMAGYAGTPLPKKLGIKEGVVVAVPRVRSPGPPRRPLDRLAQTSSPLATSMRESHVREYGLSTGLVDNKICAIDEHWSGLCFVVRIENRPPKKRE